jgi:hypothetical protein
MMLELIAVDPNDVHPVYANHVPETDGVARFHHFGFMFDTEADFHARVAESQAQGFAAGLHTTPSSCTSGPRRGTSSPTCRTTETR